MGGAARVSPDRFSGLAGTFSPCSRLITRCVLRAACSPVLQVASALMKHATDMAFDENAPVPENLADLAKAAEDEMKIDAEVMAERR